MKFIVKQPVVGTGEQLTLKTIKLEDIRVDNYAILSIDGSTTNSGLAIMREYDGALMYTITASRDKNDGETPVQYKVRLKRAVKDLLSRNKYIQKVFYEEPIVANITSVKNLFMLRTFVEELIVEYEPDFDYIKHTEVPNQRWKKEFLAPDKVPSGSENQKKAVRDKLIGYLHFLDTVSQDEIDAIAMGWVACRLIMNNQDISELQVKKKARPFKYKSIFIGADYDDDMLVEFRDLYDGPAKLFENPIHFSEMGARADFNKYIYEKMGDEDKILIIKFSSKKHGNVILEHRIGNLAAQYDYIYAIIWRVTRK